MRGGEGAGDADVLRWGGGLRGGGRGADVLQWGGGVLGGGRGADVLRRGGLRRGGRGTAVLRWGAGAGRRTGRGRAAMGEGAGRRHAGLVMGVRAVCLAQAVRGRVGREGEACCLAHAVGAVEHAVVEVDVDELRTVLHLPKESGERSEKGAGKGESSACLFKPKGV